MMSAAVRVVALSSALLASSVAIERVSILPQAIKDDPKFSVTDEKIVGGVVARAHSLPYQVSIQSANWRSHFCGGTIVSPTVIVTAAHCVDGTRPDRIVIVAGEHNLKRDEGSEQVRTVRRIHVHRDYSGTTLYNDIAVLVLGRRLRMNKKVKALQLPNKFERFRGFATVSGWGTLRSGGRLPNRLRRVNVPFVSDRTCSRAYGSGQIINSMICAGQEGKDSCQGDSGGPLMCEKKGVRKLCGVVSWGRGCALAGYPGVYTEMSYFIDWVRNYMSRYENFSCQGDCTKPVDLEHEREHEHRVDKGFVNKPEKKQEIDSE